MGWMNFPDRIIRHGVRSRGAERRALGAGEPEESPPGSGHDTEAGSRIFKDHTEELPANREWEYLGQYSELGCLGGSVQNPSEDIEGGNSIAIETSTNHRAYNIPEGGGKWQKVGL